jgi:putative flippase GtrA
VITRGVFSLTRRALRSLPLKSSFPRFVVVGATATALQYAILLIAVELLGMSPAPASVLGFAISALFNYVANKRLTFGASTPDAVAVPRFAAMVAFGLVITAVSMRVFTVLGLHYLLSQLVTTLIVLILNFQLASRWVFRSAVRS